MLENLLDLFFIHYNVNRAVPRRNNVRDLWRVNCFRVNMTLVRVLMIMWLNWLYGELRSYKPEHKQISEDG